MTVASSRHRRPGASLLVAASLVLLVGSSAVVVDAQAPVLRARSDVRVEATNPPAGAVMRYTLDGRDPDRSAGEWLAPVDVPPGYVVKAQAQTPDGAAVGEVATWSAPAPLGERRPSTLVPVTQNRDWRTYDWSARHVAIVSLMRTRQPEIVMIGDSITHFWGGEPAGGRRNGPEIWERTFANRRVVNLGYGWDRTENVLWRLRHGEFDGVAPRVAVVMIGTNNASINTPEEIAAGIEAICAEIHARSSTTRILLLGIFPRGERPNPGRSAVEAVNALIARLDGRNGITYLDIGRRFLEPDGTISKDVMYDFLHPSARGYEIWADAMGPTLRRLLDE